MFRHSQRDRSFFRRLRTCQRKALCWQLARRRLKHPACCSRECQRCFCTWLYNHLFICKILSEHMLKLVWDLYWWVSLQGGILGRFANVRVKKKAKKTTGDAQNSAGRTFHIYRYKSPTNRSGWQTSWRIHPRPRWLPRRSIWDLL